MSGPPQADDGLRRIAELEAELAIVRREVDGRRVAEARWRYLLNNSPFGIVIYRPDGTVRDANPGMAAIYAMTDAERELVLSHYNILEDPQLAGTPTGDAVRKAFAGEAAVLPTTEYKVTTPIEQTFIHRWLEGVIYPIHNADGSLREVVSVQLDISEKTAAQEEARASVRIVRERLAELEQLYATAPIGLALNDTDLRYLRINEMLAALNGAPVEAHLGRTLRQVIPELAPMAEPLMKGVVETGEAVLGHEIRATPPGDPASEGTYLLNVYPLFDEAGRVRAISTVVQDLTPQKAAEEERLRFEAKLQHAQKLESLGVLAGGIAHDFNNLLVGMLGNAELAMQRLEPDSPALRYLEGVRAAAVRASELTNQMLAYSGRGRFAIEPVDLNALIQELRHLLKTVISKKADLRLDLAEGLPSVEADASQVRQVVMNLITNASESLGDAPGLISVRTGVAELDAETIATCVLQEGLEPGPRVVLEVRDTGCGFDEPTRQTIFDPFFTTKFTGRGLGLAAVLGIVRGHGAGIRVTSEVGEGSCFTLYFEPAEAPPPSNDVEAVQPAAARTTTATVLVVDDEAAIRQVSRDMLEDAGYRVWTADDGERALELLEQGGDEVDLVVLDLTMPRMDGAEALKLMRAAGSTHRVVLSSGYGEEAAVERFQHLDLAAFLKKPYTGRALLDVVEQVLGV
ncbi:MAG: response regulator [Planctomycetota bacterium]|nr:response regulator [Planctomycetota bacterium]